MSKRLTGLNPLAYMGVESSMPPNMYQSNSSPTTTDAMNFNIGDMWINTTTQNLYVLVSLSRGTAVWLLIEGNGADKFQTDDANIAVPVNGLLKIFGGTGIVTSSTGNTVTITASGSELTFDADSGSATPAAGTITFHGTAGITTSATGSTVTIASSGTAAQLFVGDFGTATPSSNTIDIITGYAGGVLDGSGTIQFTASGHQMVLTLSDPTNNTLLGAGSAPSVGSPGGNDNTGVGASCLQGGSFTGADNSGLGFDCLGGLTSGAHNCGLGWSAGSSLTTGNYSVLIGNSAGQSYSSSESSNISINAASTTVAAESHVLRIGNGTGTGNQQLSNTYISGINGVNVGSVASVVSISGDHLGSTTITAGSGVTVTPGANTITIAATGSGGAATLIQTQTVSGVTSVTFTTGLTSTYNNYLLIFNTTVLQTGSTFYLMAQLSTNGGSSYIATGYLTGGSGPTTGLGTVGALSSNNGGTGVLAGNLYLNDLTAGGPTDYPSCSSSYSAWDGSSGISGTASSAIYPTASTTVNAIKIVLSNGGNMTGTFSLYGYTH